MNTVITNEALKVVARSASPMDGDLPEGWQAFETEDWPDIGALRAEDGSFAAAPEPLTVIKDRASASVMMKRDDRIASGITFGGKVYQTRPDDRENIAGAAQLALMAVINGAQAGDLRWHGGDEDFVWIAEDNSLTPMDAQTVMAFASAAADMKSACIFHARGLKEAIDAAADEAAVAAVDIEAGWPE